MCKLSAPLLSLPPTFAGNPDKFPDYSRLTAPPPLDEDSAMVDGSHTPPPEDRANGTHPYFESIVRHIYGVDGWDSLTVEQKAHTTDFSHAWVRLLPLDLHRRARSLDQEGRCTILCSVQTPP